MSRSSMNANDYARNWYSCNEVAGDFTVRTGKKFLGVMLDGHSLNTFVE